MSNYPQYPQPPGGYAYGSHQPPQGQIHGGYYDPRYAPPPSATTYPVKLSAPSSVYFNSDLISCCGDLVWLWWSSTPLWSPTTSSSICYCASALYTPYPTSSNLHTSQ